MPPAHRKTLVPRPARLCLLIDAAPLAAAARTAWGERLIELATPGGLAHLPDAVALVVVVRSHPDRFRGLPQRLRRRWPLAEIVWVEGPWGASAGHTRADVPPAMRASVAEATARIEAIAAGDAPMAWPWTLTRTDAVLARCDQSDADAIEAAMPASIHEGPE